MEKCVAALSKCLPLAILVVLLMTSITMAGNIIWVTDDEPDTTNGYYPHDQGYIDLLKSVGHTVQIESKTMQGTTLREGQIDTLESADLVIVARATGSGAYNDPAGWNNLEVPVLLNNGWLARQCRWQWFSICDTQSAKPTDLKVNMPDHPIFTGVELHGDNMVTALDTLIQDSLSVGVDYCVHDPNDMGETQVIAADPGSEQYPAIAYWEPYAIFNNVAEYQPAEKRMLFIVHDVLNLTDHGKTMYLNAVDFMLGNEVKERKTIIWVTDNETDSLGNHTAIQGWLDLLRGTGYRVQVEVKTMRSPIDAPKEDVLNSSDLVIVGRATGSGSYNDPEGYNWLEVPIILINAWLGRNNRWQWFNNNSLITAKIADFAVEMPEHPIFSGVDTGAGVVTALDTTVGTGNTNFPVPEPDDMGDAQIIATAADSVMMPAIVYWEADALFNDVAEYIAYGRRLFIGCGTREDTEADPNPDHVAGMFNVTETGQKIFLNAVAFMIDPESIPSAVESQISNLPSVYQLHQNFPNPFNPSTTIEFAVPERTHVTMNVYNMLGQNIVSLMNRSVAAGNHNITWNGQDWAGNDVPSGVYFYKLETEHANLTQKMLLVR